MKLTLIDKRQETADVISFSFQPEKEITWKPGQFLHYVLHHEPTDDRGSDRWFTNSAAPSEGVIRITTRLNEQSSSFKKNLQDLKVGESIEITDLTGDGDFILDDPTKEYVFLAGGIGITPFHSILTEMSHTGAPINVTLLYANRDNNVVFKEELEAIAAKNPNFKVHYIINPEKIDAKKVQELVPDFTKKIFYVSGPEAMVDSLNEMLKSIGVSEENLKGDWFPGYPQE